MFNALSIIAEDDHLYEIIFVDGGSIDGTKEAIKERGYQVIESPQGRGYQLHAGALMAQGQYLLFLHADSYFIESPLGEVIRLCQESQLGAFSLQFDPNSLLLRTIAWGSNWRVKHRNIAFGDQGICILKETYLELGGFPQIPIMEDYEFSLQVQAAGLSFQLSPIKITSSSRYFQEAGSLRALLTMQYCQFRYRHGATPEEIQAIYRIRN